MEDIILFGASKAGVEFYEAFNGKLCNVVAFTDNDTRKHGFSLLGIPIITVEEAISQNIRIVITSYARDAIALQLENEKGFKKFIKEPSSFFDFMDITKPLLDKHKVKTFKYQGDNISFYLPDFYIDHIQKLIWMTGKFYEENMLLDIQNRLNKNSIVVDVGSNIGNHTVFLGKICKAQFIYCFEPNTYVHNIFNSNVKLNGLDEKVKLFKMGLGSAKAKAFVTNVNQKNYGMAKLDVNSTGGDIDVDLLDEILLTQAPCIDLIKIDVEGMELDVLRGAIKTISKFRPVIYAEAASNALFQEIYRFLDGLSYMLAGNFNATPTYLFLPKTRISH